MRMRMRESLKLSFYAMRTKSNDKNYKEAIYIKRILLPVEVNLIYLAWMVESIHWMYPDPDSVIFLCDFFFKLLVNAEITMNSLKFRFFFSFLSFSKPFWTFGHWHMLVMLLLLFLFACILNTKTVQEHRPKKKRFFWMWITKNIFYVRFACSLNVLDFYSLRWDNERAGTVDEKKKIQ